MTRCNCDLWQEGAPYPRTCGVCGLGPCTKREKLIEATRRELNFVKEAEEAIRVALLRLEDKTGKSVESVNVDTRNFGRLSTEIFLTSTRRE